MRPKSYVDAMLKFRGVRKQAAGESRRLIGVAEGYERNPLRVRSAYKRREQLQSDLTRYYESCIVQKTSDGSAISPRDKAYCAGVAWKRVKVSGRYSDYPGLSGGSKKMARRKSNKRNRSRDRFGRFMDATESKAQRKAAKKRGKAAARKAKKATKGTKGTKARSAAKRATKSAKKSAKRAAKKKPATKKTKKRVAKKAAAKREKTMTKKEKRVKAGKKAARTRAANKRKREEAAQKAAKTRARGGKKKHPKKSAKKAGSPKRSSKKQSKKGRRKATTATVRGTRRVKVGGHSKTLPTNIRITVGVPQHVRKAAKRSSKKGKGRGRKGAHEGFTLNPISVSEYSMENPLSGGEMVLAAVTGGAGYVLTSMFDRYLATRDQAPVQGQPTLSPSEQVVAPPGILRIFAQGGIAAGSFVLAYFVPQPMGRAALQGLGLGALTHLAGQLITTMVVARFLAKNDTVRKMYPAEIAVFERLHPPTAPTTGTQGLPRGVAGYFGRGVGIPDAAQIVRPQALDPANVAPLYRAGTPVAPPGYDGGGCSPCTEGCNNPEQKTLSTVEQIAAASPVASKQQTLDSVMRASHDVVCTPGLGTPPNGATPNAMFLYRDE